MNKTIYENLESKFRHELNRELTTAEKEFLKWMAQKSLSEQEEK